MTSSTNTRYITALLIIIATVCVGTACAFPKGQSPMGGMPSGHPAIGETTSTDSIPHTPLPKFDKTWIAIKKSNGDSLDPIMMIPGKIYPLPGTDLSARIIECYSHWMIKGKAVNFSTEEKNPAVKIEVLKGETVLYTKWAFKNMPFFGMNDSMGHSGKSDDKLFFALTKYEGVKWDKAKSE